MRVRATWFIGFGLVGLLSCSGEQDNALQQTTPTSPALPANVFSRMFPESPPFAPPTDEAREQAKKLGMKGGLLDALDDTPRNNPDNPNMTEGVTFFGQFLDHDLTLAMKAQLLAQTDPGQTTNFRTAKFDLDSVYGGGPDGSPELYTSSGDIKFRIEAIPGSEQVSKKRAGRFDLPRDPKNNAIIGDSRNDENVVISQFHLAMLRFHNAVVDQLRSDPAQANRSARDIFEKHGARFSGTTNGSFSTNTCR